nr:redox-sensing transcriptional repressor Rex [Elusimicrobiota bacterium]
GYEVPVLISSLEKFLGWNILSKAYLVGAGDLGAALLGYRGFNDQGLDIVATFDNDPRKIGGKIHGKNVYALDKFADLVKRNGVLIGILAVPRGVAQDVAEIMIRAGIRAIWNFTSVRLLVPPSIIVQDENLASSLAVLSKRLAQSLQRSPS